MRKFKHTPEEARKLWVEALRSGKFKQGQGSLAPNQAFRCCLGVACELYARHEDPGLAFDFDDRIETKTTARAGLFCNEEFVLPDCVREWLGFKTCAGALLLPGTRAVSDVSLTDCNDHGETFEQIANHIERGEVALAEAA